MCSSYIQYDNDVAQSFLSSFNNIIHCKFTSKQMIVNDNPFFLIILMILMILFILQFGCFLSFWYRFFLVHFTFSSLMMQWFVIVLSFILRFHTFVSFEYVWLCILYLLHFYKHVHSSFSKFIFITIVFSIHCFNVWFHFKYMYRHLLFNIMKHLNISAIP